MFVTILKKYVWVINLILLTALAYFLATSVNGHIESKFKSTDAAASQKFEPSNISNKNRAPRKKPESFYQVIITRNIFNITPGGGSSGPGGSYGITEDPPETSLNLVLLGTIMNTGAKSVAILKNPENSKVQGYRGGDKIDIITNESVTLVHVKNCKAVIQRKGKPKETIKCKNLGDDGPTIAKTNKRGGKKNHRQDRNRNRNSENSDNDIGINKTGENEYEISRETLEEVLGDPTQIVQEARVIPQKDGLRFFGIRSNSIFWKIGIKNGDTLHNINNVELSDVEKALGVFEELRGESNFTIEYTRAGQKYTNEYTVTD